MRFSAFLALMSFDKVMKKIGVSTPQKRMLTINSLRISLTMIPKAAPTMIIGSIRVATL